MKVERSKLVDVPVDSDQGAGKIQTTGISADEKFESWHDHGNEVVQEEDGEIEAEEDDDDDEEGDIDDVQANHPNDATGDGCANSTINARRKKVRKRRRVRKRNTNAVNDVVNEGSHHSTNIVVEGVKPSNPSSPAKASSNSISSPQVQPNQKSKKPHDAPMTKSDLYYSVRCGMVQVEVDVMQSLPRAKSSVSGNNDPRESVVVATILRDVIGRVLLVNWDNVKVYDAFVVPELSSTQQTLLQEEFKAFKSSQWTDKCNSTANTSLPYTFQIKRFIDFRTEQTGIEHSANVSMVSISELKPILKKLVKGKIVIGYNVQADLQVIDGITHPKTDVRDIAQYSGYMSTIVTARPMSLHFSQDRRSIVHYEPRPLSMLMDAYVDPCCETNSNANHGVLFKEAVGCLHLYKRVRSAWEDELSRLSRFRYNKFPPMSAKSNAFSVSVKSSAERMSPLPPPVSQHELLMPLQHNGRPPMKHYCQEPSQPMMKILPTDLSNNRNKSLPMSPYYQSTPYVDRGISVAPYDERRHHPSNPPYPEDQRWNPDHALTGTLDPPSTIVSSRYHRPQQNVLPVSSPTAHSPQRPYFGPTEYGTSPRSWEIQHQSEANQHGTERLSSTSTSIEGMRWSKGQDDAPTVHKAGITLQEDPWRPSPSFQHSDTSFQHSDTSDRIGGNQVSMIPSSSTSMIPESRPLFNSGIPNYLGSFDSAAERNSGLQPTPSSKTWSPLLTDSFSLLSVLNKNVVTSSDPTAPAPPLPRASSTMTTAQLPKNDPVVLSGTGNCDDDDDVSNMFQWESLLSSINDATTNHR